VLDTENIQDGRRSDMNAGKPDDPVGSTISKDIVIMRGFPEGLRAEVARIYDAAFGPKLAIAIPDVVRRLRVLEAAFDPSHCFVAVSSGRVLGIAGFRTRDGGLTSGIGVKLLRAHLGSGGGVRAILILALFARGLRRGELLMDGIAISPEARGGGVGTRLLVELMAFGAREGYLTIRLDVIDTNEGARRLYERLGFVPRRTSNFGYLRWLLGFSAATTLEYRVRRTDCHRQTPIQHRAVDPLENQADRHKVLSEEIERKKD
jgi:ribosomal protein S18 acetylase RimI-like enzyme